MPGSRRHAALVGRAILVREDGDEPPVAGVEVEVALGGVVEVRLLEDERHAEHALPEVDRRLPVRADDRDVVDALGLDLPSAFRPPLDELRLVLASRQAPPRHELDACGDDEHGADSLTDRLGEVVVALDPGGVLDGHGQRRLLLDACRLGPDEDVAADARREAADDVAHRRREDVDAAHDQHVVGAPDAAHPRPRAPARARARPHLDVVARAEAQERRRAVAEMREHELAGGAVLQLERGTRLRIDQLGVDEAARAEVHPVLLLALAPERDADVADAHRLGDPRAPALLELRAERRLAAARLAGDEDALDARAAEIDAALRRPLEEMRRVRRREHRRLGSEIPDRLDEALGVPGADRDVREADPIEGGERGAGHERAGVVGRDDALAGRDARGRVAARRAGDPVVEVAGGQRDVARRPGRAARRVDADDLRASRRGARRPGSPASRSPSARCFSVSGSRAISASPPASAARRPRSSFSR